MTTPKEFFTGTDERPRIWTVSNPEKPGPEDAVLVGQRFRIQERARGSDNLKLIPVDGLIGDGHWPQVWLRYFPVDGGTVRGMAADNGNFVVFRRRRPGEDGKDRIHSTVIRDPLRLGQEQAGEWDAEDDGG